MDSISTETDSVDFQVYDKTHPDICTTFEEVDTETKTVTLSDGSVWNIIDQMQDQVIQKISTLWEKEDDIRLALNTKIKSTFIMKNVRTKDAFLVKASEKCSDLSKAFFIKEVDRHGYALKTTDGRLLITGYIGSFTVGHWKEGMRVVINHGSHINDDYEVIDPKLGNSIWASEVFKKN